MVRLSLVNLYLHGFNSPQIFEYDSLTYEDRWDETFDVILANPPFMTPKGGIRPHKRFQIQANRAEVLFVDYIAEHLKINGRAGIIVPEGIIFQSSGAYKGLRKMLIDDRLLWAVVSLPSGVFNPYSGVKTCILFLDKELAKKSDEILFVKVENDGFDLGAQRRRVDQNDLPRAFEVIKKFEKVRIDEIEVQYYEKVLRMKETGKFNIGGRKHSITDMKDKFNKVFHISSVKMHDDSLRKAINWIENNVIEGRGIGLSAKKKVFYPEVTGYLIPTLYAAGEKDLARQFALWLINSQNKDGSFSAIDEKSPYPFDTGQVIRGFLCVLEDMPETEEPLRKSCDYIIENVEPDGRIKSFYKDDITEYAHLYVLPPLLDAGKKLGNKEYFDTAGKSLAYYKRQKDLVEFKIISHFYGYIMEALADLGEIELAKTGMSQITALQRQDGSIPAYPDVEWVCAPGLMQLAIAYYKLGMKKQGDDALKYIEKLQNRTGGFFGSYGKGANYFPAEEISWAVKFFIDAYILRGKNP